MVFCLKEAHVMFRSDQAPLQKFVYSVTKMIKWIVGHRECMQLHPILNVNTLMGKETILVDSFSRLRHLGLQDDNDPEEPGQEYGKSIFDMDEMKNSKLTEDSIF